jgi:hypothetical protein
MSNYRRRTDNLVLLHSNVAALPFPTGAGAAPSEKVRAPDGTASRFAEIRIIGKAAGPINIPGPVFLCGNEDVLASQGGNQSDEWNQIGPALNGGAAIGNISNKRGYSEVVEMRDGYRALALFNGGAAITGGNIDVQLIPLYESYS